MKQSNEIMPNKLPIRKVSLNKDERGTLGIIDTNLLGTFTPVRQFWITGVSPGIVRGRHGHIETDQLFVCLSGVVTLRIRPLHQPREILTLHSGDAVLISRLIWLEFEFESVNDVLLVLANKEFEREDYFEDEFHFQTAPNLIKASE